MPSFFVAYVFSEEGPRRIPPCAIIVCLPAGRPGSHVLVHWLHVLVGLETPRWRPPFYISFKLCGVLPASVPSFAFVSFEPLRLLWFLAFCLFSFRVAVYFSSEASKPHHEVWGRSII